MVDRGGYQRIAQSRYFDARSREVTEQLRLAELIAALSLATDVGMGQPLEQALRTCLIALELGERLHVSEAELGEIYYTSLLRFLGCTADAHEFAQLAGGDDIALRAAIAPVLSAPSREFAAQVLPRIGAGQRPLRRARLVAGMVTGGKERARAGVAADCEVAETLAQQLGLHAAVRAALASAFEQWNGAGLPAGVAGEDIPLAARIVFVARDVEVLHRMRGADEMRATVRARRAVAYDPGVADAVLAADSRLLAATELTSPWDEVLRREPEPRPWVPEARLDTVLGVFADFADLKSPYTAGHSREVAELAAAAAADDSAALRHAALLHDIGRTSVPNSIWEKPGPLTDGEWERVRLHPYYSERIIARVTAMRELSTLAGMHHERVDGSGYHRSSVRADLPAPARLLATADAYQAMTQPRPHREALPPDRAATELESMARDGRLDSETVTRVLNAAGHRRNPQKQDLPAGLSEREVEVLRLICRGETKKTVARRLSISPSTVDHHVRHIYEKCAVRSRAAAALFAVQHDLLR